MMGISWKLYDGNFLELYAGKFRWMPAAFRRGNYGIMLWHQTTVKAMTPGAHLPITSLRSL